MTLTTTPLCPSRPPLEEGLRTYQSGPIRDIPPGDIVQVPIGYSVVTPTRLAVTTDPGLAKLGWELLSPTEIEGAHRNIMARLKNISSRPKTLEPDTLIGRLGAPPRATLDDVKKTQRKVRGRPRKDKRSELAHK